MLDVNGKALAAVARQTPFTATHPPVTLKPTLDVLVALPEIVSPDTVVVPKPVLATVSHGAVVLPTQNEKLSPATELTASLAAGDVVPTPSFPSEVSVVVAVPPNCAKLAESRDEEALVNLFRPVQKLESDSSVEEADEPEDRHVPLIA